MADLGVHVGVIYVFTMAGIRSVSMFIPHSENRERPLLIEPGSP